MMTEALDDYLFNRLLRRVQEHNGLDCSNYKVSYLKRRVAVRMRATNSKNYKEYERILNANKDEYDLLLDRLTINVSHFFRDISVFEEIKRIIVPELSLKPVVKIWSAGCANGEEPYTLAMLFDREWPYRKAWKIVATDLDPNCLIRAKEGRYLDRAMIEMPYDFKRKYFSHQDGYWCVNEDLKRNIIFRQVDLTGTIPEEKFDLILCRNVLIYFLPNLQMRLFERFRQLLSPDGFLVLGKTETLLGEWRRKYQALNGPERIFKVKSDQTSSPE